MQILQVCTLHGVEERCHALLSFLRTWGLEEPQCPVAVPQQRVVGAQVTGPSRTRLLVDVLSCGQCMSQSRFVAAVRDIRVCVVDEVVQTEQTRGGGDGSCRPTARYHTYNERHRSVKGFERGGRKQRDEDAFPGEGLQQQVERGGDCSHHGGVGPVHQQGQLLQHQRVDAHH